MLIYFIWLKDMNNVEIVIKVGFKSKTQIKVSLMNRETVSYKGDQL